MDTLRFKFGANWESFSKTALNTERIAQAKSDFVELYSGLELRNKSFIDIGFGQGLTLFLASELGAKAHGIDIDPQSDVAIQETRRFFDNVDPPTTTIGSILDKNLLDKLLTNGQYDIVHAWGSLHHSGNLWEAVRNAATLVKPGGILMLAIYQRHWSSPIWKVIKWSYNKGGETVKKLLFALLYPPLFVATWVATGKHPGVSRRGMDFGHDVVDWIGGYPYEYANPGEITLFLERMNFVPIRTLNAKVPTGNNEMLFQRN